MNTIIDVLEKCDAFISLGGSDKMKEKLLKMIEAELQCLNFAQGNQAIKDAKAQSGDRRTVCPKPRPLDIAISDTVNELVLLACQECGVQGICKKDCEIVARGKQIIEIVEEDKRHTVCKPENEREQKVYNTAKR